MKNVLFVCTGNTCRSPMAEFILKDILQKRQIFDIAVSSAGISVDDNSTINPLSKAVLERNGIVAEGFVSREITDEIIEESDVILCMTENHKNALPTMKKVKTLGEVVDMPDVSDPYGGNDAIYTLCYQQIKGEIEKLIDILLDDGF